MLATSVPVDVAVLDFKIGDRRLEMRIPIHKALVLVDQPFLVQRARTLCRTASERPSSMVKRSRLQSQSAPRRLQLTR